MKPEDRKRLKRHIDMVMNRMDDINGIPENYRGRKGIANDVNNPAEVDWRDEYRKLKVEFDTLRFKESEEQRFIWWIWNVYSRNVQDLILDIMGATTYDTEGEAKDGKYALPKHCFDLLKKVDGYTEHIYDGTYLDVEISTGVKTSTDNNKRNGSKWKAMLPGWGAPAVNKRYLVKLINGVSLWKELEE